MNFGRVILDHITVQLYNITVCNNAVLSLHTQHARYEEVDAAMCMTFEEEEVPNAPTIRPLRRRLEDVGKIQANQSKRARKFILSLSHPARQSEHI